MILCGKQRVPEWHYKSGNFYSGVKVNGDDLVRKIDRLRFGTRKKRAKDTRGRRSAKKKKGKKGTSVHTLLPMSPKHARGAASLEAKRMNMKSKNLRTCLLVSFLCCLQLCCSFPTVCIFGMHVLI